jgi:tape measure domain-containing protein
MNSSEIAELSARVSITGLPAAQAGLQSFESSLKDTARTADASALRMSAAAGKSGAAWQTAQTRQRAALGAIATGAKLAAGASVLAGGAAVAYGIKLNASMETAQASFATFLGSMKKAKAFTEELRSVSSKSPLKLTDYAKGAQLLLGFGVNAKQVIPILGSVNKAVVATGKSAAEMEQITRALGQIQAKGKASAEELLQLAEAGAPVNKILQKELKLTGEQVANIGDEGIKSGAVLAAIARGWNKQFGPAYKNAATTFNFQFASATKNAEQLLRIATAPIFNSLSKTVLPAVNTEFQKLVAVIDDPKLSGGEKWKRVGTWFDNSLESLGRLANEAIPKIGAAIQKALPAIGRVVEKLTPIVAEGLARLAIALVPLAVVAGANIAKGLVKGFLEADWLGKILVGGYLLRMTTFGAAMGMSITTGLTAAMNTGKAAAAITSALGGGMFASGAAGMQAGGRALATSLVGGMAKVIGPLAAVFAIGDILSSAIAGDMKAALTKGGFGAIGAGIGAIVGGPIGAAIGGAIGVGIGGLIDSITKSGADAAERAIPTLTERVAASGKQMAQAIKAEVAATSGLRQAANNVVAARERQRVATQRLKVAEIERDRVLATHAATSAPAIQAEARYAQAKRGVTRATYAQNQAERLSGVERTAAITILRNTVAVEKQRLGTLRAQRRSLLNQLDAENKLAPGSKRQAELVKLLNANGKQLTGTQNAIARSLQRAAREIGPKYARELQNMSVKTATMRAALGQLKAPVSGLKRDFLSLNGTFSDVGDASTRGLGRARDAGTRYQRSTHDVARGVNSNMRLMPPIQFEATGSMIRDFRAKAEAVTGFAPSVSRRRGGTIPAFHDGGMVPAMVSPGEMLIYRGRASIVPGKPEARDSVAMHLPTGTAVATWDGQARLAAGESLPRVMATQAPHFAAGGIVKPTIAGGSPGANKFANRGVSMLHTTANKELARLREIFSAGVGEMDGKKVANWIIPILQWARTSGGWSGSVSSGFRSYAEQAALYANRGSNPYPVAPPGTSNHEGSKYPRGAVDVSDYSGLNAAVDNPRGPAPGKLKWFGPGDAVHFSGTGNRRGGFVRKARRGGWLKSIKHWGPNQLATLAAYVGLPNPGLMSRIAAGESGGNPLATNNNTNGTIDRGLWQINSVHGFGGDPFDPLTNALQAKKVFDSQGIGAWYAPPTGRAGVVDPDFMNILRYSPAERQAARKGARKKLRAVGSLKGAARRVGVGKGTRKRIQLATKFARIAKREAGENDVAGAKAAMRKATKFGKKARADVRRARRRKAAQGGGNAGRPGNGQTGGGGGGGGKAFGLAGPGFDPKKPFGPGNYPGGGALPDGTIGSLRGPDLNWQAKRDALDLAEANADLTGSPLDNAAVYGAIMRLETQRRNFNLRRVAGLNKSIRKAGGKKRVAALTGKIGKLNKARAAQEKILRRPNLSKAARKAAQKALRKINRTIGKATGARDRITGMIGKRDTALSEAADATRAIGGARDSLRGLNESAGGTSDGSDLAAEIKALRETLEEQNRLAARTQSVAGGEIGRAVRDWLSGELVGKGAGFSAAGNTNVRY